MKLTKQGVIVLYISFLITAFIWMLLGKYDIWAIFLCTGTIIFYLEERM